MVPVLLPVVAILLASSCGGRSGSQGQPLMSVPDNAGGLLVSEEYKTEIPLILDAPDPETNTVISHMGYTVSYNSRHRIPNWVAYELLDSELYGDFSRGGKFGPDPAFKGRQAYDRDYSGSGWDRGHMAPSGDMKWSSQTMKECFYLTNICPQDHNLNSGDWNDLEKLVRKECRYYKRVWIACGPVIGRAVHGSIGENMVTVPDGFFKALLARRKDGTYTAIGFYFENKPGHRPLSEYAMSIDDLEKLAGMDFFYILPAEVQDEVERCYNLRDWRVR